MKSRWSDIMGYKIKSSQPVIMWYQIMIWYFILYDIKLLQFKLISHNIWLIGLIWYHIISNQMDSIWYPDIINTRLLQFHLILHEIRLIGFDLISCYIRLNCNNLISHNIRSNLIDLITHDMRTNPQFNIIWY